MKLFLIAIFLLTININTTFASHPSSCKIRISEIFPNPEGKDKNKEWIELFNTSNIDINLKEWSINNSIINKDLIIKSKSHQILEKNDLKSLKNSNANIKLLSPQNKICDEIEYKKSIEGKSFTHTSIINNKTSKSTWQWTSPTKSLKNKAIYEYYGEITTPPQINTEFHFKMETHDNKTIKVIFSEEEFDFQLLQTLLIINTPIAIIATKEENEYNLIEFDIKPLGKPEKQKTNQHWEYYLLIPIAGIFMLFTTSSPSPSLHD